MKPQPYLTKNGKDIFNFIYEEHLKGKGDLNVDSFKLSALANAFDLHERSSYIMNFSKGGFAQVTKNGYSQVKAEFTVWQKSLDMINKLSPPFGIDPASREKIAAFAKKNDKIPDLS